MNPKVAADGTAVRFQGASVHGRRVESFRFSAVVVEEPNIAGFIGPVRSALGGEHEEGNSCENSVIDRILLEKVGGYGPLRSNMFSADYPR